MSRAVDITIEGKPYKLWLGYPTLRRLAHSMGCGITESLRRLWHVDRDADGTMRDLLTNQETLCRFVAAGLHTTLPANPDQYQWCGLTEEKAADLIDTYCNTGPAGSVLGNEVLLLNAVVDAAYRAGLLLDAAGKGGAQDAPDPTEREAAAAKAQ